MSENGERESGEEKGEAMGFSAAAGWHYNSLRR